MRRAVLSVLVLLLTSLLLPGLALAAKPMLRAQYGDSISESSAQQAAARFLFSSGVHHAFLAAARNPKTWETAKGNPSAYLKGLGVKVPAGWHVEFSEDAASNVPNRVCSYETCESVTGCMCGIPCRTCTKYVCVWHLISCNAL